MILFFVIDSICVLFNTSFRYRFALHTKILVRAKLDFYYILKAVERILYFWTVVSFSLKEHVLNSFTSLSGVHFILRGRYNNGQCHRCPLSSQNIY